MPHQPPPPQGAYVEDPASGRYYPIEQEGNYPNGNIAVNGQMFPHESGMDYYRSQQQQSQPAAAAQPNYPQVATAHDGVPIYQDPASGKYYTKNGDGSYTEQTDTSLWQDPGGTGDKGDTGGAPPPGPGNPGLVNPWTGGNAPGTAPFTPPAPAAYPGAPSFTPPEYKPPPAFEKPTWDEARNDPGYEFVQKMGQQGLERSAAARGVLNTGGTLKDIAQWNQGLADTQYSNVFNRDLNQYMTNYQTQFMDPYKNAYTSALDQFNPQQSQWTTNMGVTQRANEFNYLQSYDQYKFAYQQYLDRINNSMRFAQM